jgi:endoglucanase
MPEVPPPIIAHNALPRWRGFNLLEKFDAARNQPFLESDFALMAEWGFDFARLPMSYLCWTDAADWLAIDESALSDIDQAVAFGRQYNVHVNLNLHRAPGYCVNPPKERASLWSDPAALEAAAHHWAMFAKRYKGIANDALSFDLLNEPADIKPAVYVAVITRLVAAIREEDPDRLIIADGLSWGRKPVPELIALKVAQSTRGYAPNEVSHYKAPWLLGANLFPLPTWPMHTFWAGTWNKARLYKEQIEPWLALRQAGVGVHVGEWGAYRYTPHDVTLAWMRDWLALWRDAGFGWALWNLRGDFGVLNSNRADVQYETFRSHHLDRAMLELLQSH